MYPVLVALAFHLVMEADWYSLGSSDYFVPYDFMTGTV